MGRTYITDGAAVLNELKLSPQAVVLLNHYAREFETAVVLVMGMIRWSS